MKALGSKLRLDHTCSKMRVRWPSWQLDSEPRTRTFAQYVNTETVVPEQSAVVAGFTKFCWWWVSILFDTPPPKFFFSLPLCIFYCWSLVILWEFYARVLQEKGEECSKMRRRWPSRQLDSEPNTPHTYVHVNIYVRIIGVGCADVVHRTRLWTCQLHYLENHLTHKLCIWGQKCVGQLICTEKGSFWIDF